MNDIANDGVYESGKCLDQFIKDINSHITGACMIPMKLPKKEVVNIIERAKEWFYKHYEDSVMENYYIIDHRMFNNPHFKKSRRITLPDKMGNGSGRIYSVNKVAVSGEQIVGGMSSIIKSPDSDFNTDKVMLGSTGRGTDTVSQGSDLLYYVVNEKLFDLARQILLNMVSFRYSRLNRQLLIKGETPRNNIILEVLETIDDCSLYSDEIFFRYVAAQVKKAIGTMIMMFGFDMPGNVTLNGDMIRDDAQSELDEITEEIKNDDTADWFFTS